MQRVLNFHTDLEDDGYSQFELELDSGDIFSPNRTRSGKMHGEPPVSLKRRRSKVLDRDEKSNPVDLTDGDMADTEEACDEVPDVSWKLPSVPTHGKLFSTTRERRYQHDLPSSPVRGSSPPSHRCPSSPKPMASPIRYSTSPISSFDMDMLLSPTKACTLSSSFSSRLSSTVAGRSSLTRSRLRFDSDGDLLPNSCPLPTNFSRSPNGSPSQTANVNPFTPQAMHEASMRRNPNQSCSSWGVSLSDFSSQDSSISEESEQDTSLPAKRLRVSDMSITRYQEEFLELAKVASGQFGTVVKARHKLDGIVYAIKITKRNLRANSLDEKMAMNEVFAHAALMKNKHVVRYFNSWVEKGQIYIQNEFCDGGSLDQKLLDARCDGKVFSEDELHRLLLHIGKGLKYIHSRQLVHLDIKPANIFLALDPDLEPLCNFSADSGAGSGDASVTMAMNCIRYKIGDLGHMSPIQGVVSPTEGDCRYMAPEFLQMELNTSLLSKADMYSTGMTVYEATTLAILPRNSDDDPSYERLKNGLLPPMPKISKGFYKLLRSLVNKDPAKRLTASKLVTNPIINPLATKSKNQLWKELQQTRLKLAEIENKIYK